MSELTGMSNEELVEQAIAFQGYPDEKACRSELLRRLNDDGWVAVEDGLPKGHGDYLTYVENGLMSVLEYFPPGYDEKYNGWYRMDHLGTRHEWRVDYYRPLPAPPKLTR